MPAELVVLTLPEKVLITKCFPAAYIIKLFPKEKGVKTWARSGTNNRMKGSVSTYCLNMQDFVNLVDPFIMPPIPQILAATIRVTIVGPQNLLEKTMPGFLRVKQSHIKMALKTHNPLYMNIIISNEILDMYPENDVIPEEILSLVKYSDDVETLESEWAGYVVEDDDLQIDEEIAMEPDLGPPGEPVK